MKLAVFHHDAAEWWSFDHSAASSKDHSEWRKTAIADFLCKSIGGQRPCEMGFSSRAQLM